MFKPSLAVFLSAFCLPCLAQDSKKSLKLKSIDELTEAETLKASDKNLSPHSLKQSPSGGPTAQVAKCHSVWGTTLPAVSEGRDVAIDPASGKVCAIGTTTTPDQGKNILITCYDHCGVRIATKAINGPFNGDDLGFGIAIKTLSNIFVTGSLQVGPTDNNIWIGKFNLTSQGLTSSWTATLGDSGDDQGRDIALDASGNIYVIGFKTLSGSKKIWLGLYTADTNQ